MRKIIITILKLSLLIVFIPLAFYVTAFYIPFRLLQTEQVNGLVNYSGNEKVFARYAMQKVAPMDQFYTGAKIIKLYHDNNKINNNCLGNNESYISDSTLKVEVITYGMFGIEKYRSNFTGCTE